MWGSGFGWICLAVLIAALLGVAYLARGRRKALDELTAGIERLAEGRPVRPVQMQVGGRAGRLARIFNEVVPRLERRIDDLEGDRQLLRAVLSGMTEGVVAVDGRRRLLFANVAAERMFDLGPEDVGRMVAERVRIPRVQQAIESTLGQSSVHRAEIVVPAAIDRPGAPERVLAVRGTPLPGSPPSGAVLVVHDVTATRRLERVRRDFVANASHELKTPLAAIKAYAETLLDGALGDPEVNVQFLRRIDEQADRLDRLVRDLLSLARIESGQELFRLRPLALAPLLARQAEVHRERARARGLSYAVEIPPEAADAVIRADEEAIREVLDNLIDNAIKYTPSGGRVRVSLRAEGEMLAVDVADTGIGIPRDELSRVFERFYRVDQARSRELGGTGLGLSIVKHLAHSHGGSVTVESRPGAGSTFTVRFPIAPGPSEGHAEGETGTGDDA